MPLMVFLTVVLALQVVFMVMGHLVMRKNGFYKEYAFSQRQQSPNAFTLVCPGVALAVLGFFWLHAGLVNNGIIERYSVGYSIILGVFLLVQMATLVLMGALVKNQLRAALATQSASLAKA